MFMSKIFSNSQSLCSNSTILVRKSWFWVYTSFFQNGASSLLFKSHCCTAFVCNLWNSLAIFLMNDDGAWLVRDVRRFSSCLCSMQIWFNISGTGSGALNSSSVSIAVLPSGVVFLGKWPKSITSEVVDIFYFGLLYWGLTPRFRASITLVTYLFVGRLASLSCRFCLDYGSCSDSSKAMFAPNPVWVAW